MLEEILKAHHCQNSEYFFPSIMVTMYPIDLLKFVEIMSIHHETHKKKALKLIRPMQDHFSVSLVQNKPAAQAADADPSQ